MHQVVIWDDAKQKAVITLEFRSTVRRVRLTRNRIVAVLQNSVHVYIFSSPPEKVSITETADNPLGLCCLSSKLLAFPGLTPGQVQLIELESGNVRIVPAHTSALRAIEISPDGEVIATASEVVCMPYRASIIQANIYVDNLQGTLIRLFSTSNGARIAELRRGVDHATIFSISISPSSLMLAVTSDKSTLHVFDIPNPSKSASLDQSRRLTSMGNGSSAINGEESPSQKWGILSKIPLLPRVFSDIYSFTSAHIELGDDTKYDQQTIEESAEAQRPQKGVIGWTNDHSIVVVSAGKGGRWEKFILAEGKDGKRYCIRDGWMRYLSPT